VPQRTELFQRFLAQKGVVVLGVVSLIVVVGLCLGDGGVDEAVVVVLGQADAVVVLQGHGAVH
jgi:hypothetical protein